MSKVRIAPRETYLIPSNTYYLEDSSTYNYLGNPLFFYGTGQTVRWVNIRNFPEDGTSVYIPNLNVRTYYE